MKRLALLGALLLFGSVALAADQTTCLHPRTGGVIRAGLTDGDNAELANSSTVPAILNTDLRPNLRVQILFSQSGASVTVHVVRGDWFNGVFSARDVSTASVSAVGTGTLNGKYYSNSVLYDMAGFNAAQVLIDRPSAGSVDTLGWVY